MKECKSEMIHHRRYFGKARHLTLQPLILLSIMRGRRPFKNMQYEYNPLMDYAMIIIHYIMRTPKPALVLLQPA